MMILAHAIEQMKTAAEFRVHGFGGVPHHFQATASLRAFRGETRDDHMTARSNRTTSLGHVGRPILRIDQEVKDGTIVPDREASSWKGMSQNISRDPLDEGCTVSQALLSHR